MSDAVDAAALFQEHRSELGFVNRAQCREGDLYVERREGSVVGAALCNHCVRKPQTTLYDIAVDESYRRSGIATSLIESIYDDSPHGKLVAKCPSTLPSVQFYVRTGWQLVSVEAGKNRQLTVWQYTDD